MLVLQISGFLRSVFELPVCSYLPVAFKLFPLAAETQSKVSQSIRLSIILPLPIRRTHRSQMITYESMGPEREKMRRTVCQVFISYLFTPNHRSLSYFLHVCLFLPPLSFPFCSSLCPSITPSLTISPDPMLILILLPHGSITHFSHFCIHTKERGAPLFFLKPPQLSPPIPPNIDLPNVGHIYHLLLYMISFSITCRC